MEVSRDSVFRLEDVSMTKEAPMPVVTLDSENRQKLFDLPNPKPSTARASVNSACMEQMLT